MFKNFVFIIMTLAIMTSCDTGSQSKPAASSLEEGKILLADANTKRVEKDDLASKRLYKQAVIAFEKAAKEDPNQKGLASLLGQSQYRIRDFDKENQWLNKAVGQDKTDFKSLQFLGYCQINKTKIQEAQTNFQKAISIDKSGTAKKEIIEELTNIGELSLSLGENFTSQGNPAQGVEFQKLGMRILAMALDFSGYDMTLAKKIQIYAHEMNNQILMDWIDEIILKDGKNVITIGG